MCVCFALATICTCTSSRLRAESAIKWGLHLTRGHLLLRLAIYLFKFAHLLLRSSGTATTTSRLAGWRKKSFLRKTNCCECECVRARQSHGRQALTHRARGHSPQRWTLSTMGSTFALLSPCVRKITSRLAAAASRCHLQTGTAMRVCEREGKIEGPQNNCVAWSQQQKFGPADHQSAAIE